MRRISVFVSLLAAALLVLAACGGGEPAREEDLSAFSDPAACNKMLPLSNRCRAIDDAPICRGLGGYLKKGSDTPGFGLGN